MFKSPEHLSTPLFQDDLFVVSPVEEQTLIKDAYLQKLLSLMLHFISATDFNVFEFWDYIKSLPFSFVQSSSKIMVIEVWYYIGTLPVLAI